MSSCNISFVSLLEACNCTQLLPLQENTTLELGPSCLKISEEDNPFVRTSILQSSVPMRRQPFCKNLETTKLSSNVQWYILTIVKIVTRVPPHQKHIKRATKILTNCIIAGPRRKSRILPRAHRSPLQHAQLSGLSPTSPTVRSLFDLRSISDIRNGQVSFRLHLSEIVHPDIQFGQNHPTSRKSRPHNKGPPRKLPSPHWIQLSSRIPRFTKSVTPSDYSHVLNVSAPLFQWGQ